MRFRAFAAVPFVALALAGCGSSSGGSSGTVPAGATVIKAIDGIAWDAKTYSATAVGGQVTIALQNDSSLPHNLHLIDSGRVDVGLALDVADRGKGHIGTTALKPGTYTVICTIAGHGNMKASLTVS
jgi:plastocyanin